MDNTCKDDMIFILEKGVRFEPENRCLVNEAGAVINLPENSYRFFLLLLEGETDKQNIINQVWHEQRGSVSDSSYYGQIYTLRKSLDLIGLSSSLIKTIPRKGVKYTGSVVSERKHASTDANVTESEATEPENIYDAGEIKVLPVKNDKGKSSNGSEWYRSRSWNVFISIMSVLAACWITTLIAFMIYFFTR